VREVTVEGERLEQRDEHLAVHVISGYGHFSQEMTIAMTDYPLVKAKEQLSRLIDKALAGEEVTITRHGKPVVDLRPRGAGGQGHPTSALIDEIAARAKLLRPLKESAAESIRRMRDEER
jgi:prevent-host-death family protein